MGLFLKQSEQRSELQSRVASEVQERLRQREGIEADKPDPVLLDNSRQASGFKIIITIVIILFVGLLFWLLRP